MSSPSVRSRFPQKQRQFVELIKVEQSTVGNDGELGMFSIARYKFKDQRIDSEHFVGLFPGHARKLRRKFNAPGRVFTDGKESYRKRPRKSK